MTGDLRRYAAANARVRALLAGLLGRSGLEALYSYPSRTAMLDVLLRTGYASAVQERAERGLPARLIEVGHAVLPLLAGREARFIHQYVLRAEVENLKLVIRAVYHGLSAEQIAAYVLELGELATIDLRGLLDAHDLPDLIERLRGSAYGAALSAAAHGVDDIGPFALEVALELDYYERLWSAADTLHASDTAIAHHLLGILFDILNLRWIARYRDALGLSPEEILNYTLRQGRWVTAAVRRTLAEDAGQPWGAVLAHTPYAPLLVDASGRGFDTVATALWRVLGVEIQRRLRQYPFQIGVPLGFLLAQEIEIRDLQVLFAAKDLNVPAPEALECVASVR